MSQLQSRLVDLNFAEPSYPTRGILMDRFRLSQDQRTPEEQALFERLGPLFEQERLRMARALATGALLGQKEFELRDAVHELGAKALEAAADERQKKGGIRRS